MRISIIIIIVVIIIIIIILLLSRTLIHTHSVIIVIIIIVIIINNHCYDGYSPFGAVLLQCSEIIRKILDHVQKSGENGRCKIKTLCVCVCVCSRARMRDVVFPASAGNFYSFIVSNVA